MAKPHLFPDIPEDGLTLETQLYTQRLSNAAEPQNYKFTLGDLTDFLTEEGFGGYWEPDGANALMQISDNDNIILGNGAGSNKGAAFLYNTFIGQESGFNAVTSYHNNLIGYRAGYSLTSSNNNNFFGNQSGYYTTTGIHNTGIGFKTLFNNNSGSYNVALGQNALYSTLGSSNIGIGRDALYNNTASFNNGIGFQAGYKTTTGASNYFFGYQAGYSNTIGSRNFYLGNYAGFTNISGSDNILIGTRAGYFETGSNRLYISNTDTSSPLIYGEFINELARINGYLEVRDKTGTPGNFWAIDGDRLVDSGVNAGSFITDYQDLILSNDVIGLTDSLSTIDLTPYINDAPQDLTLASNILGLTNSSDTVTFAAGTNMSITQSGSTLTFNATGGGSGGAVDTMQFRTFNISGTDYFAYEGLDSAGNVVGSPLIISEGAGIQLNGTANGFSIEATGGGGGGGVGLMDLDTITGGYRFRLEDGGIQQGDEVVFAAGTNMSISRVNNVLTFNASGGGSGGVGSMHLDFMNANDYRYRLEDGSGIQQGAEVRFVGGTNMSITRSGNILTFNASGGGSSVWTESGANVYVTGAREVGINTTNPTESLHVIGDIKGSLDFHIGRHIVDSNNSVGSSGQYLSRDSGGVIWKDFEKPLCVRYSQVFSVNASGEIPLTQTRLSTGGSFSFPTSARISPPKSGYYKMTFSFTCDSSSGTNSVNFSIMHNLSAIDGNYIVDVDQGKTEQYTIVRYKFINQSDYVSASITGSNIQYSTPLLTMEFISS